MRRTATIALAALTALALMAPGATAKTEKFTFEDVTIGDRVVEIEAGVKTLKNKPESVNCSYFTDDYEEHLGYHFEFVEPAPTDPDDVLAFCVDGFDERET